MRYVNLTPHEITFKRGEKSITLKSEGILRCTEYTQQIPSQADEYVCKDVVWDVKPDVPPQVHGTIYIVSQRVERFYPERMDIWYPGAFERDPVTLKPQACTRLKKCKTTTKPGE